MTARRWRIWAQFDVEAPAVVGGGIKSAEGILVQLRSVDPVRASTLQAQIAEAEEGLCLGGSGLQGGDCAIA